MIQLVGLEAYFLFNGGLIISQQLELDPNFY